MREIVAIHLENGSVFYRDFLARPNNADTEADENAFIDTIHDYHSLRNGAWGDHVATIVYYEKCVNSKYWCIGIVSLSS